MDKWLIAIYPLDHNEGNSLSDVTIRNGEKEARKEFESYCNVGPEDELEGNAVRIILAKVTDCVDVEIVTKIKKTVRK